MPVTVEQLWSEKYAALLAAAEAQENDRRAEDFLDIPRTVCGLPLRAMTPRDLLVLDYAKSPFVSGGEITAARVAQFLCALHDNPPRGWLANRRFFRHCAELIFADAVAEIRAYVDRVFADAPVVRGEGGKPIGAHFVAPLIVSLCAGIPGLTPQAVMNTPLPQLFQYRKVLDLEEARRTGGKFRDRSPADTLLHECLEEANRINVAEEAAIPR